MRHGRLTATGRALCAAALCAWGLSAAAATPLRVCALSHNLPYSARATDNGYDLDVARAVAAKLARPLETVWVDNAATLVEIDDSDYPVQRLQKGACDAIFSMPGPAGETLKEAPSLRLGAPYYGAAFELIGPGGTPPYLKSLRDRQVAIQAQTVASFAIALLHGHQRTYFSPQAALEGVSRGEASAALVWGPVAGWQLKQQPALALSIAEGYAPPPGLSWNLHVATRADDAALRETIDRTLAELSADGSLARIAGQYGIPWRQPFAVTYSLTELNKLR